MIETMDSLGRILIADADETNLLTATNLLERAGYQCTPLRDGVDAVRELAVNEYDLLITETNVPGNEEFELVRAVSHYAEGMPVIIITRFPSLHTAIASVQLRVTAYLIKPVEASLLIDWVKTSIANYREIKGIVTSSEEFQSQTNKVQQVELLSSAIEETIQILQSTRSSFKSKKLAALRRKLQHLLAGEQAK